MRKCVVRLLQAGLHTPAAYKGAKMKHWPEQKIPADLKLTEEQRFRMKALPRDTGRIARDFVLSVLYQHQPCEVDHLWEYCTSDPRCVLDSKRHLRAVLKQAREEGWITFEESKGLRGDQVTGEARNAPLIATWQCILTRDRYPEVKKIIAASIESSASSAYNMRGSSATETSETLTVFQEMNQEAKAEHLRLLREQVAKTTEKLKQFHRTEIDYLPYTDLNGKVQFMWWYETRDQANRAEDALPTSDDVPSDAPVVPA